MAGKYDAIVIGSGPNGLAAAITVAERGGRVLVIEKEPDLGGGMRTRELTLPGYLHDVCSAVHPLGVSSPFFLSRPFQRFGLEWIEPPAEFAHPLDDGTAAVLERSVEATAEGLGEDGPAYSKMMTPLVREGDALLEELLRPILHVPRHPLLLARFGTLGLRSAKALAESRFRTERARALLAGIAGHSMIPLTDPASSALALVLGVAGHLRGWPFPKGGSRSITGAMVGYLRSLGGELETGRFVRSLDELPDARRVFLDTTPRALASLGASRLTDAERARLRRFRYGAAVFKLDFALARPVPWTAAACARTATVHVGGSLREIAAAESEAHSGRAPARPFVLLTQPSRFDSTRAPQGKHTLWAYCHVPSGATGDFTAAIEAQIERFAPGFRETILARHAMTPADFEAYNPNFVGGDIGAGALDLAQILFRPRASLHPYATPIEGVYLCSASTPPGPGVHGMGGLLAAELALSRDDRFKSA